VRWVIAKRVENRDAALSFLVKWEEKHKDSLRQDVTDQWNKGSKGRDDEWY
jgi:hypothetical protein